MNKTLVPTDQVRVGLVTGDKLEGEIVEIDERNLTIRVGRIFDPLVTVDKLKITVHWSLIEEITSLRRLILAAWMLALLVLLAQIASSGTG